MQNHAMGSHLDPQLEDRILHEVKSQGVFDEFRKDSMADVDTKPAYQNLRQRVENTVKKFLTEQQWSPDMNKNQLREKLRKHIAESGFLDVGVERIVDQVVNPKISTVFQPRIEEITYKYLGLPPPPAKPPPPIMHPLPPLPLNGPPLKIDTNSLLPTGLEQISPDSDKAEVKSECREDDKSVMDMDIDNDEKVVDDDDESPPFEPLVKCADSNEQTKTKEIKMEIGNDDGKPLASTPKKESFTSEKPIKIENTLQQDLRDGETQDTSASATTFDHEPGKFPSIKMDGDVIISQDSQLSKVSSDSNISDITPNASHSFMDNSSTHNETPTISDQTEAAIELASANISEEAQMPKFNENSTEIAGMKSNTSQLHFDIKKDEIKFEGTERKSNLLDQERESNSVLVNNSSPDQSIALSGNSETKEPPHHFSSLTIEKVNYPAKTTRGPSTPAATPAATPTPTPHDSSFGSSLEDVNSQVFTEHSKDRTKNDSVTATNSAFSTPMILQSDRKEISTAENRRSSSSSRHKKHSKDKRRSHGSKEKHRDRDRSKNRVKSKDESRDKSRDESRDKERGKYKDKDKDKDRNRDKEKIRDKDKNIDKDRDRSRDKKRHKDKDRSKTNDIEGKEKDRSRDKDKDRSRKEHKHSKSKHDSTERSDSSKRASSNTDAIKIERSSKSKHTTSLAPSSGSSSRSESHDARREKRDKRESDKKPHHSSSSNGSNSKKADIKSESMKTEISVDDHNVEKVKVSRRRSTDSNDEDKGGGRNVRNGGHERENEFSNSTTTTNGKQTDQPKDTKHTSPSSQSPKAKSNGDNDDTSTTILNVVDEPFEDASAKNLSIQHHHKKVIILNDMLENPNINFIELGPTKTSYSLNSDIATACNSKSDITSPILHTFDEQQQHQLTSSHSTSSPGMEKDQLLFFEDVNAQFINRLRLLDNAMDRCRRVVNNLRFDCVNEFCEGPENLEENRIINISDDDVSTMSSNILTIDCVSEYTLDDESFRANVKGGVNKMDNAVNNADIAKQKRKRDNKGQLMNSKLSPTLSDASVNSKENVALDKNGEELKCVRRIANVNKLNQQQRYNSEDLYKPRPVLSQRSRRRGVNTII